MVNAFFILLTVAVCTLHLSDCEPRVLDVYQSYPSSHDKQVEYDYRYAIDDGGRSGVVSDRWEQRIGEFVKGAYSLLEPNGKIRTVNYEVDGKRGFHATVKTTNPANVLLSNQQLEKYNRVHPEPFINLYTRKTSPPPIIRLYKDPQVVPPNYHAIMAAHAHTGTSSTNTQINEQIRNNFENYYTSTSLQPPPSQLNRNNYQLKFRQHTNSFGNRHGRYYPFF